MQCSGSQEKKVVHRSAVTDAAVASQPWAIIGDHTNEFQWSREKS